jgi:hypothetical protein
MERLLIWQIKLSQIESTMDWEASRPYNGRASYSEVWIHQLPAQCRITSVTNRTDIEFGVSRLLHFSNPTPWYSGQGIFIIKAASNSRIQCNVFRLRTIRLTIAQNQLSLSDFGNIAVQWSNRITKQPKRSSLRCRNLLKEHRYISRLIRESSVDLDWSLFSFQREVYCLFII